MAQTNADLLNNMSISSGISADGGSQPNQKETFPAVKTFGSFFITEPPVFETWLNYMKLEPKFEQIFEFVKKNGETMSSLNVFNRYVSDYTGKDDEGVTIMILPLVLDYLSHSLENLTFIPDPTALSFVFHEIVIKDAGSSNNCPSQGFLLIKKTLRKFPPRDIQSRLYWLKVLMPYKYETNDKKTPIKKLNVNCMLEELTEMVRGINKEEVDQNLLDFLLELFEVDLYFTEYQETNTILPDSSTYHEEEKDDRVKRSINLLSQPLAYLLLDVSGEISAFVPYELHSESKKFMYNLSKMVAENEEDMQYARSLSRLQLVFMEAARFMRRNKESGQIHDWLTRDFRTVLRKLVEHKVQKKALLEFYPISWVQPLIASLYSK